MTGSKCSSEISFDCVNSATCFPQLRVPGNVLSLCIAFRELKIVEKRRRTPHRFRLRVVFLQHVRYLCDNGAGGGGLVLPVGREDTDGLVVAGETVDTRLDENEAELAVLVLAVALEVLADSDSLLDQHVEILREIGGKAGGLQDTQNAVTSDDLDLGNAVGVTQDDANLRRGSTLTGELGDLVNDLLGSGLQPGRGSTRVRNGGGRNALSLAVKTTHFDGLVGGLSAAAIAVGGRSWMSNGEAGREVATRVVWSG
jgi:hypothetical protein